MTNQRYNARGTWLPLMEFAMKHNISLSTLRRHIKASKVSYKVEEGRYLLWDESDENLPSMSQASKNQNSVSQNSVNRSSIKDSNFDPGSITKLERDLKQAQEEIAELKTLIALYEENIPQQRFNG